MNRMPGLLVVLGATALVLSACTSTTGPAASATRPDEPLEVVAAIETWETPSGETWAIDVVAPADEVDGGWPVLVTFHGSASGTSISSFADAARSGIVVVAPRWIDPAWDEAHLASLDPADYADGALFDVAWCALGASQDIAADHGGDVSRTTVEGFSAGVHPAAWVSLGVVREDLCADRDVVPPVATVLGDAQWLFEAEAWDATFEDPGSRAPDTVDRFLDSARWSVPDGFSAYLWSSRSNGVDRVIESPPSPDSWLRTRGGEDIVDDLAALGAYDDGVIGFIDNNALLEVRMQRAGIDVVLQQYPGDHSRTSALADAVIDLIWTGVSTTD